jgi:molecular chaperone HtpG
VRRFEPAELATLYSTDPDAALYRASNQNKDLGESPLNAIADAVIGGGATEEKDRPYAQLMFNFSNPLVRRLATVRDRGVLTRSVQMLYVQSLLLGHHPLSARELSLLNGGLTALIEAALGGTAGGGSGGGLKGAA